MSATRDDEAMVGRILGRREVLALLGTSADAALWTASVPQRLARTARHALGAATATTRFVAPALAAPACIVRPEQTEGPYFVDERLARSDIRIDPSDGSLRDGVPLKITFVVGRLDGGSCTPFAGVHVDVWHCDAAGVYSDVSDPSFDTTGQKFRGSQVTGATGAAIFFTIFPGWYEGRTVHIHWKLRTDPDAASGLEFTSQLYFDDALTDIVHAGQPYAAKGQRTLRNAGDGIFASGGDQLLLAVTPDGGGGYAATFDVAIDTSGTSGSTTTTTTTLPGASCTTIAACLTAVESTLPNPATATSRRARRVARRLRARLARVTSLLERASETLGARKTRLFARAQSRLEALLALARAADARDALGVALAPLEAAVGLLLQLPA
jgi:protocatechuate 3,4-dioxygenase beta subunit